MKRGERVAGGVWEGGWETGAALDKEGREANIKKKKGGMGNFK